MKIRPKVPVCTDCDHVFEYRGRNPGQLGGVVVQFGEAYCTKKKKPRLFIWPVSRSDTEAGNAGTSGSCRSLRLSLKRNPFP